MTNITEATFDDRLASSEATDGSLADEQQALCVFSIEFYKKHGRADYCTKLANARYKTSRRDGMCKYITAHTNLKVIPDPKNKGMHVFVKNALSGLRTKTIPLPLREDGSTQPWYEFTPEVLTVAFDIDKRLESLIKAAKNAIDGTGKAKIKGPKAHAKEIVKGLEALVA